MFIIIGIIAVILIFTLIAFSFSDNFKADLSNPFVKQAYNSVEECIKKSTRNSIYFNLLQGGYYHVPKPKVEYYPIKISVYWDKKESYLPPIGKIEKELSLSVRDNLKDCLSYYDHGEIKVNAKISEDSIIFDLIIPIKIETENRVVEFSDFEERIGIDFYEKYNYVSSFLEIQKKKPSYFPIGYLTNLAYENEFEFEILEIDSDTKIVTLVLNPIDDRGNVAYNFALEYDEES